MTQAQAVRATKAVRDVAAAQLRTTLLIMEQQMRDCVWCGKVPKPPVYDPLSTVCTGECRIGRNVAALYADAGKLAPIAGDDALRVYEECNPKVKKN
jgi:hypothetical protein